MPLNLCEFLQQELALQKLNVHRHFSVTTAEDNWPQLLRFAAVKDIEEFHDEYYDDAKRSHLFEQWWLRRRTDASGETELIKRHSKPTEDGLSLILEIDAEKTQSQLEEEVERLETMTKYKFTRYYLDTARCGFDLYIDVLDLPTGGFAVVGTINLVDGTKLASALEVIPPVLIMPVPSKVYQVLRNDTRTSDEVREYLQQVALKYELVSPAEKDPLKHHQLVDGADVQRWFGSVNGGAFDDVAEYADLKKMSPWELSTLNLDDLQKYSSNKGVNKKLVLYLRAFSYFRYYELASSLRTNPGALETKDWLRISMHTKEELMSYGNVPEEVASHMLRQSHKALQRHGWKIDGGKHTDASVGVLE